MRRTRVSGLVGFSAALLLTACSAGSPPPSTGVQSELSAPPKSPSRSPSGSSTGSATGSATGSSTGSLSEQPSGQQNRISTGWGPSRRNLDRAAELVSKMSTAELAGQVIVAQFDGTAAPSSLVNGLDLGGVIVMSENVSTTKQVHAANADLQASAARAGRSWPVFIGIDQEGGIVERVQGKATRFPALMTAGAADDPELTTRAAAASGAELNSLGFTTVFAPDADVTSGPDDPTIGSRSAGSRPRKVAEQMNAAVDGFLSAGILPVVKHFPGHGSVPADSHLELPVQSKSLSQLMRSDLVPFESAVSGGVSAVMVAHIDVRAIDPGTPSTMSRPVVTGLLRERLGFDGLVITDALNMEAVAGRLNSASSAVRALRAGNDVLLMPPNPNAARDGIVAAIRHGRLPRARVEQAATRQVAMLLHQRTVTPSVVRRPGTSKGISRRLSAAGVTVVSGPCRGRLVGPAVSAEGSSELVAAFNKAAARAGLLTGNGTSVALIGYGGAAMSADVVVSTDTPYALGASSATTARIALYGDTPGAMSALVDVLLGRARAPGQLPVEVAGVERTGC